MADKIQRHFDYGFTMIDNRIFDCRDFDKLTDKYLYMTLIKFSYGKEHSFPSITTLAESCLCARSTLKLAIDRLEKKNYIKKEIRTDEKGNHLSNIYHLYEIPDLKTDRGVGRKSTEGGLPSDRGVGRKSAMNNISLEEDELKNIVLVIDYLNKRAGTRYKSSSVKTRQLIHARIKEGFTVDDFKLVIERKCKQWINDGEMSQYLRPSTLFSSKHFEEYLNEIPKQQQKPDTSANTGSSFDKYK